MQHVNVSQASFPCSYALYFLDCWTVGESKHAKSQNFGAGFFSGCACKLLFHTNCLKVWLWISQCEDLKFANVSRYHVLWLFLQPLKWENAPLTQKGFVWTNECDNDGSIQISWWPLHKYLVSGTELCTTGRDQHVDLLFIKLSTFQRVWWGRCAS